MACLVFSSLRPSLTTSPSNTLKKRSSEFIPGICLISSSYAQNYFSNSMTLDEINEQLSALDTYLNADIWIVDTHGKILINTADTENTDENDSGL